MHGDWMPPVAALAPILCAPLAYALARQCWRRGIIATLCASGATLMLTLYMLTHAAGGAQAQFTCVGFCGLGLYMRADGFRALYALVAGFMWLVCSIFSLDYFKHEHDAGRYSLFTLITLGAVVGLFLSDTLYSAFLFFEIMSLSSYPWVAHERTREAMRAAETYLYIAIIGGLVMLMGLFMLPNGLASAPFTELSSATAHIGADALRLPAILVLVGFGAKAGAFPLHIWLPKAHPVAPAPASALLSGLLTKAGIFGVIVLALGLMRGDAAFGDLIFRLGVITMVLGAVLAVFSVNLKRTLACSSLSQIGFIMVGIGSAALLGDENGLAAMGTVEHMLNHSIFKLVLFLCAGVVAMNEGALALNDIRGFGRGKPALRFAFLMGALGISGVPTLSGYASKSLLHEGILELIARANAQGGNALPYQIGEWLFIISGGMTLCYMTKLYVCLFHMKRPSGAEKSLQSASKPEYGAGYLSPLPKLALCLSAALIPLAGLLPSLTLSRAALVSLPFMGAEAPAHAIEYFSAENLLGAFKSILTGAGLYAVVRLWLMRRDAASGCIEYVDRLPKRLDLEDIIYRPLLKLFVCAGYGFAWLCDRLPDWLIEGLKLGGKALAQAIDKLPDKLFAALELIGHAFARIMDFAPDRAHRAAMDTVFTPRAPLKPIPVGNRITYTLGLWCDRAAGVLNRTVRKRRPISMSFEALFAAGEEEAVKRFRQVTRSISFGLIMFCLGLIVTLGYLLM